MTLIVVLSKDKDDLVFTSDTSVCRLVCLDHFLRARTNCETGNDGVIPWHCWALPILRLL